VEKKLCKTRELSIIESELQMTMTKVTLRTTKFFAVFYGDALAEKEIYARSFEVVMDQNNAVFSLKLLSGLDADSVLENLAHLDTFVLEDAFLCSKMAAFLQANPKLNQLKLVFQGLPKVRFQIARVKLETARVVLYSQQLNAPRF
tara:strand:- start:35079 stop:35516 length:438 start_codon:yes stop_codon:yes gene_type:complete